ncbi:MAG: universal stress protein [Planctomycetes bacterium]|nr:universal stress protein [Planctomycetota bacterium]
MFNIRKILYATDFSSYSNQAYFHAIALAEHYEASLTVVNVWTPDSDCGGQQECKTQLETIRPANPGIPVHHVFLEGDPATEIVRLATDANMDLVVMGTHGRSFVERLLMGSVAEKVMRDAHCSVLVVKLPKGQPKADRPSAELAASY